MPATWELLGRILVVTVAGEYDPNEFDRVAEAVQHDPRYRIGLSMLYDARRCEAVLNKQVVDDWIRRVAGLRRLGFSRLCAIVVSGEEPYRFGMARMAAAHLELMGVDLLVTKDFDDALVVLAGQGSEEGHKD